MKYKYVRLSDDDKLSLISNLSTMLAAGISILEIVESLSEDAKGSQKIILNTLRENIIQGKRIHTSFAEFPSAFDKVTVNLIKAAEEAGTLEVSLKDLKENTKKEMEFKDKIRSALIYPVLIILVFFAVFFLILFFIIPKIAQVFTRLKVDLPLPTRALISLSNILTTNTLPIGIITFMSIVAAIFLYRTQKRLFLDFIFSLPLLSKLAKEIDLTRTARSLSLLLNSGIPIITALDLAKDIAVKKEVIDAIAHSKDVVLTGKKLSDGFKDNKKVIPSIMIKITEAGERSGSLEKTMQEASDYLDYRVTKSLKTVTTLIEPIMLVFVGLLIGGMMLSIIAPVYGLIGQVGGR